MNPLTDPMSQLFLALFAMCIIVPIIYEIIDEIREKDETACPFCGTQNKTDADFCEKCGKKIA